MRWVSRRWKAPVVGLVIVLGAAATLLLAWKGWQLVIERTRRALAASSRTFAGDYLAYQRLRPYRAMAVGFDRTDGPWAWGWGGGYNTVREAIDAALRSCEGGREQQQIAEPCRLYALNDEVVFDYAEDALRQLLDKFKSTEDGHEP